MLPSNGALLSRSPSPKIELPPLISQNLGLIVAVLYGVVSVSITVFNKAVLSGYGFHFSNALSLGQGVCSLAFLFGLRNYRVVHFPNLNWKTAVEVRIGPTIFEARFEFIF